MSKMDEIKELIENLIFETDNQDYDYDDFIKAKQKLLAAIEEAIGDR